MKYKLVYIFITLIFSVSILLAFLLPNEYTYYDTDSLVNRSVLTSDTSYKTRITTEKNMNTDLFIMILTSLGVVAAIIFDPIKRETKSDIKGIKDDILLFKNDVNDKFKKLQVKQDLDSSLREIAEGVIEITSGELSGFINYESELFIKFSKEVICGSFNVAALPAIKTKLHGIKYESNLAARKFGEEFFELHHKSQSECVDKFYKGIEDTLMDDVFNTKHKRFRMLCEQFLHTHLTDSVKNYMKIKGKL